MAQKNKTNESDSYSSVVTIHPRRLWRRERNHKFLRLPALSSLLRSRSGRSHVTLPVPTRLLQTDIHSFLGVVRFFLLGPMSLSVSCHCIRCTNHRREHSQEIESHTLIGLFPRKECMSVWSSRVGTGSVTWLRPERLRRRLRSFMQGHSNENSKNVMILNDITCAQNWTQVCQSIGQAVSEIFIFVFLFFLILFGWRSVEGSVGVVRGPVRR